MQEIDLYDLIKYYVKKWRIIVGLTFIGLVCGLAYNNFIQVPLYKSNTKLILVSQQASSAASNQTLINNYIDLITSRRVLDPVIEKQEKATTYEKLLSSVNAVNQKNTAVIDVSVSSTNAQWSADIANAITDSFKKAVNDLYKDNSVIVVDPAVKASVPSNINKVLQLTLATTAGFLLSVIALFFIYDYRQNKGQGIKQRKVVVARSKSPSGKKRSSEVPVVTKDKKSKSALA